MENIGKLGIYGMYKAKQKRQINRRLRQTGFGSIGQEWLYILQPGILGLFLNTPNRQRVVVQCNHFARLTHQLRGRDGEKTRPASYVQYGLSFFHTNSPQNPVGIFHQPQQGIVVHDGNHCKRKIGFVSFVHCLYLSSKRLNASETRRLKKKTAHEPHEKTKLENSQ